VKDLHFQNVSDNFSEPYQSKTNQTLKMKTFIEKLFVHLDAISHPDSGWLWHTTPIHRKKESNSENVIQSPDCFNIRNNSVKNKDMVRRNPMP
jgi:hypothetical protein